MNTPNPTPQEIEELIAFLPRLCETGFSPVKKWHGGDEDHDGVITMPYPEYDPTVMEFIKVAERECWTDPEYLTKSAGKMLDDEDAVKSADLGQIKTMLTFCVRGERFFTGHWGNVIENGYVRRLLQRLAVCGT
jgi:hypothetical protein